MHENKIQQHLLLPLVTGQDTASSQHHEDVGLALHKMRETANLEVVNMMHTAKLLSSAMFVANTWNLHGNLEADSLMKSIQPVLLTFVSMLVNKVQIVCKVICE